MSINKMILNAGIANNEAAFKALEKFYTDQQNPEEVPVALYHLALGYGTALSANIRDANIRDDIIAASVEGIQMDLPKLMADSDSAPAFASWCSNRLKAVINNKKNDHHRRQTTYLRKHVSGDSLIPGSEHLTLFSMLKGPDPRYFQAEKEAEQARLERAYRKQKTFFYRQMAQIVINECPTYVLGFWCLLGGVFASKLDIPLLYLNGRLDSFATILHRINVEKDCILQLTDALEKSQVKFVRKQKTEEQSRKRCSDYKSRTKKILQQHSELRTYIATK